MNKKKKAELRRLAELVYERELGHWLAQLDHYFGRWRRGEIPASELSEHIHEYHQGPARYVWSQHVRLKHPDQRVAWGLAQGVLDETEIDPELLELVQESAEVFRELSSE